MLETKSKAESARRPSEQEPEFDMAASVRMLQYDLTEFGQVRPETWEQVYNEELTYVSEGINAPLKTRFEIKFDETFGFVNQRGETLTASYQAGYRAAQAIASKNPGLEFEVIRRHNDLEEIIMLEKMMKGEVEADTMVVFSPFPEEAYRASGGRELEMIGYQPQRKLGFMRICRKLPNGNLEQVNISVDNSNAEAFKAAGAQVGLYIPYGTQTDNYNKHRKFFKRDDVYCSEDLLLNAYDASMKQQYGREFRAGRPISDEVNAWEFIAAQRDLCQYYFKELEKLALVDLPQLELRETKTALTAAFWASLKDRLAATENLYAATTYTGSDEQQAALASEMNTSLAGARQRHEMMIGCGGGVNLGDGDLLEQTAGNMRALILGNKGETWVWKKGRCVVENCPTSLKKEEVEVGPCSVCRQCQAWFELDIDPSLMYAPLAKNITAETSWGEILDSLGEYWSDLKEQDKQKALELKLRQQKLQNLEQQELAEAA